MPDDPSERAPFKSGFHVPVRSSTIGMNLFLAALFMLFAASILGYVLIRNAVYRKAPGVAVEVPRMLWISTVIVVAASFTIQFAVGELRREHMPSFRRWLLATMALAVAFLVVQTPAMVLLLEKQSQLVQKHLALYGLIFVLILLHALHVLGGVAALGWTSRQAGRNAYDHENYHPVARVALYWHFLDGVWLAMFFTFLLMG
jgi:heme/copper-type cytochrome/quinol oxidase subunit 3